VARDRRPLVEYVVTLNPREPVAESKWPDLLFALDGLDPRGSDKR
jgi:hypothetical protein